MTLQGKRSASSANVYCLILSVSDPSAAVGSCIIKVVCISAYVVLNATEGPNTVVREVWVVTQRASSVHIHRF